MNMRSLILILNHFFLALPGLDFFSPHFRLKTYQKCCPDRQYIYSNKQKVQAFQLGHMATLNTPLPACCPIRAEASCNYSKKHSNINYHEIKIKYLKHSNILTFSIFFNVASREVRVFCFYLSPRRSYI